MAKKQVSYRRAKKNGQRTAPLKKRARTKRGRKVPLGAQSGRDSRRTLADPPELSSVARLIDALRAEKIRFVVVGMTAAVLQGVPVATFDIDIWIDLPSRQYIRILNLSRRLGGRILANTVVLFDEETTVNFLYQLTGLHSFRFESKRAKRIKWFDREVSVLPLERIHRSKSVVRRPKDEVHLFYIEQAIALQKRLRKT